MRDRRRLAGIFFSATLLYAPGAICARQQAVLYSSGFGDGDLSFWTMDGPPGSVMEVESTVGQPPGALRLTVPSLSQNLYARSPCFALSRGNGRSLARDR